MDFQWTDIFKSELFMPHGHCYLWKPHLVWLHVISDAVIALSYYAIPILLVYFIFKKQSVPFNWLVLLFALFICGCGTTHLMEIVNVWKSEYAVSGVIKLITAFISLLTAALLVPVIPKLLSVNSFDIAFMSQEAMQAELKRLRDENKALQAKLSLPQEG